MIDTDPNDPPRNKSGLKTNYYANQLAAQAGYDTQAKDLTSQGYVMSDPTIANNTISGTGTRTANVKAPKAIGGGVAGTPWENKMRSLLNSGVSYEELAKEGHGYTEALKKRFPGEYKPKTEEKEISTEWADKSSSGKGQVETEPKKPAIEEKKKTDDIGGATEEQKKAMAPSDGSSKETTLISDKLEKSKEAPLTPLQKAVQGNKSINYTPAIADKDPIAGMTDTTRKGKNDMKVLPTWQVA